MFTNRIVQTQTADILINRSNRQRSELTPDSIIDLAYSIAKNQWISPILIDETTNHIIAGERRLTAVKALRSCLEGDYEIFSNPDKAREKLARICTCQVASWQDWTKIPTQLGRNLTPQDVVVFEFIENAQREGLNWQDKAKAIYSIHAHGLATEKEWNNQRTGVLIGLDHSSVAKYLKLWRTVVDIEDDSPLKLIVKEATTLQSALQAIDRYVSRRQDDVVSLTNTVIALKPKPKPTGKDISSKPGPAKGTAPVVGGTSEFEDPAEYDIEPESIGSQLLLNQDFNTWAEEYEGEPFNFIHCDFPYGINFNKASQGSSIGTKTTADYDDDPEIYWNLLETLAGHQEKLIAPSAHIMFWFSQNLRRETEDFFKLNFPTCKIQSHLMIWHSSDNNGIIPDSQRYGRRTYETAILITFGDRFINSVKALSFSSSSEKNSRMHRSQKPLPVLNHFFEMFVDDSSRVLDPTAGSGTSLITAHKLKAKQVVGLEMSEETHEKAVEFIDRQLTKEDILL